MATRLEVQRRRRFSAHHMLIGAANAALEDAESKRPGWFYAELMAISMASMSIEAMSNAIGEQIIENWKDFESASPVAKVRLICDKLELRFDETKEPWSSIRWLAKLRNEIAHAKPQLLDENYIWSREEYETRRSESPKSKLEKKITLGNARRAVKRVEELKDLLCLALPPEERWGLYSDSWFGSASATDA